MDLREMGLTDVDWIHLAQDGDWWWGLMNISIALWHTNKVLTVMICAMNGV
jgi:hypothetical protein